MSESQASSTRETGRQVADAITGGVQGFMQGAEFADRRKQREQQQQQINLQMQQQQQAIERGGMELGALPQQLAQQQRLGEAQITGQETQTQVQQVQLQAVQAHRQMMDAGAAEMGLPEARPGETLEQYKMRKEAEGDAIGIQMADAQVKRTLQQIAQDNQMNPLQLENARKQIELASENMRHQRLVTARTQRLENQERHEDNINQIAVQIRRMPPEEKAQYVAQLQESGEIMPGEIAEAEELNRTFMRQEGLQDLYAEQLDPNYKRREQAIDKMQNYDQALQRLTALSAQISSTAGEFLPAKAEEKAAVEQAQQLLRSIGKGHIADRLESGWRFRDMRGRRQILQDTVKALSKEFMSDMSSPQGLGVLTGSPRLDMTFDRFSEAMQRHSGMPDVTPMFSGAANLDFGAMAQGGGQ